jgi:hypothetical protein
MRGDCPGRRRPTLRRGTRREARLGYERRERRSAGSQAIWCVVMALFLSPKVLATASVWLAFGCGARTGINEGSIGDSGFATATGGSSGGGATSSGIGAESGAPSNTGDKLGKLIACGRTTCIAASQVCCVSSSGARSCAPIGQCPGGTAVVACAGKASCPAGQVCCLGAGLTVGNCATTCVGPQSCLTDADCPSGQNCRYGNGICM